MPKQDPERLPRLYTLKEVREATQYRPDTVRRKLRDHPEIEIIGSGRGTRFTLKAYHQLLEALTTRQAAPAPPHSAPKSGQSTRAIRRARTKALLKDLR